jgi:prophage regulatory protein
MIVKAKTEVGGEVDLDGVEVKAGSQGWQPGLKAALAKGPYEGLRLLECTALLPMATVKARTSLSPATIYRLIRKGEFPRSVRLSPGRVGWRDSDIQSWLSKR